MAEINFFEVTQNEHFQNLAAFIRRPTMGLHWRQHHPEVPFWNLLNSIAKVRNAEYFKKLSGRTEFIGRFTDLLVAISQADSNLIYTAEDLDWFVGVMNSEYALPVMSMLFAYASAPMELITPAELAELTSTGESTWRNRAAAGELPGSIKKGKQWLIPRSFAGHQENDELELNAD